MKKTILTVILSIVFTAIAFLVLLEIASQNDQLIADKVERIDSKILGEKRKLLVHLPWTYESESSKKYPLLLVLDGSSQDYSLAQAAQTLAAVGHLPEMIIVGIPNSDRNRDLTPHQIRQATDGDEMGEGDAFTAFLEKEVIAFMDQNYRTKPYRMISGNSRGGLFSFYTLLQAPHLFDAYFCFSPAFWRDDHRIVAETKTFLASKDSLNAFIYMSLGSAENPKMTKGYKAMVSLLEKENKRGLHWSAHYTPDAVHRNNFYYSLPQALQLWGEDYRASE